MTILKALTRTASIAKITKTKISSSLSVYTRKKHDTLTSVENPTCDRDFLIKKLFPTASDKEPYLKAAYGEPLPRPTPFPYETHWYGCWDKLWDQTKWRLDRNSKVIIVEGNAASGKSEVAKQIAYDYDLKYFPSPSYSCDDIFILNGLDLRELNHMIPWRVRHYDLEMFHKDDDPKNSMPGSLQFHLLKFRIMRYADAMVHLLSTGQGVVIERSCYGDVIYPHILEKLGLLSPIGLEIYWNYYKRILMNFLPPHLTVYLDTPVSRVREAIKKRNIPYEVNSKYLTDEFIELYNHFAETVFLPHMSRTGELLMVDASNGIDAPSISADVGNIDLTNVDNDHHSKFQLWFYASEQELSYFRHIAQDRRGLHRMTHMPDFTDAPELSFITEDAIAYREALEQHPRLHYEQGYEEEHVPTWKLMLMRK